MQYFFDITMKFPHQGTQNNTNQFKNYKIENSVYLLILTIMLWK